MDFKEYDTGRRRLRAGVVLLSWWSLLYLLHQAGGLGFGLSVLGSIGMMSHIVQMLVSPQPSPPQPLTEQSTLPTVSILVPCRNEALVIEGLVQGLSQLVYPQHQIELWIADDRSTDSTGEQLRELQRQYPQLQVYSRPKEAKAGKSAVLNELLARSTGEMIVTFDADAQVDGDFLYRTLAYFETAEVGALQVRRVVMNSEVNFWTKGQKVEMLLDAYYQQQRIQVGGTGELRGNGQVLRRSAILGVGGWNEETITDDLDLTLRLHLAGWEIGFCSEAPVYEEGVTRVAALWRQRQRWAEGGFQRYLDYGPLLLRNGLGTAKSWDQGVFLVSQYLLPIGIGVDVLYGLLLGTVPRLGLLLNLATVTAFWGMVRGQRDYDQTSYGTAIKGALLGSIYFLHWLPVMIYTLLRMALLPKRLAWVKTARVGSP